MARKLKNVEKCERHTVGPAKWQKTKQNKNKNKKRKKKLKKVENETQTLYELEYGEKH